MLKTILKQAFRLLLVPQQIVLRDAKKTRRNVKDDVQSWIEGD